MKKYAKIINEETKQCDVGLGTNENLYKFLGMKLMDVEQAYNVFWYILGHAPQPTEKEIKQNKINELKNKLKDLDYIGVKIATGCATIEDYADKIALAESYRQEIRELQNG